MIAECLQRNTFFLTHCVALADLELDSQVTVKCWDDRLRKQLF